jgi:hypothetical protein
MSITQEQLVEGPWWYRRSCGDIDMINITKGFRGNWAIQEFGSSYLMEDVSLLLDRLITPVASYRETNTLVVIGYLGNRTAYVNLSRDEAIKRYVAEETPDTTAADLVESERIDEYEFVDKLWAYDVVGDRK